MQKSSRLLILVAALAAQLWLTSVHAFQHPATQAESLCQLCLHAPSLDHGAAPVTGLPPLVLSQDASPLAAAAIRFVHAGPRSSHPIRGPPITLR
ncbi:MAG TPA: hypothetical protein VM074_01085 [Solimonas sp.]|nr:hypothetical protein [Solimonas sp.]